MNSPQHIQPEKLLSVLFHSPNATAVYTGENIKILSANDAMLKMWGKDRSVLGKEMVVAIPELSGQPFIDILKEVWNSGQTYTARDRSAFLEIDGEMQEFYFDFEYKALLDSEGKTEFILHTAVEVSERMAAWNMVEERSIAEQKLNEELLAINEEYQVTNEELIVSQENLHHLLDSLNESEKRFRTMVEQSPVAMASLKGKDFTVDMVNDGVLAIWGKDRSVIGLPLRSALPELENQPFIDILTNVYDTGSAFYGKEVKVMVSVDGTLTERFLNFVYHPTKEESSGEKSILIVANDITEMVNARLDAEEMSTRLQIAIDAGRLGSTEVNLATGIMKSTDQFKMNYGFLPEENFTYSDLFESIFPEYRESVKELVQEAIRTNGVYKADYPIKWRDGSVHWIQAHGRPRYDEKGNADRMVGMTADITDKKLFEQRKDDFLSVASHELKTPVTVIKACLQLLDRMKDRPFSDIHLKLINQSVKNVEKMSDLVDDLLNVKRLNEGQLKIEKKEFNLFEMLQESCSHITLEDEYKISLEGEPDVMVFADMHRLDQVVINFVNNAVKYAPSSKNIHIKMEKFSDAVKVSVRDFGYGIEKEVLPKLFDRFFRADHSGKEYNGLGLGLYICSEIIEKHGGTIGAESEINQGSTFWFTIPLV
ncbi:ATP-binding protein [Chryseobacterium sp. Leaf394]|uniref:PAS domain-containing sensor histidine kinase n=1 Tax=Chryseobacterium sp. Leaf394 TaxID=1736361 RepID=UPI0006F29A07|nr:ATP-binding protein [Chryseobacterium sp. Leaf394]KQS91817.1 hypothetical protein ASG21_04985 [Chryseobacterium sp. Leaf394]